MPCPPDSMLATPVRAHLLKQSPAGTSAGKGREPRDAPAEAPREEPERLAGRLDFERARMAADMRKWATALTLLRGALGRDPGDAAALGLYGYCLARLGQNLEAARAACRRAVDMESYVALHHAHLGWVYRAAGLQARARECFREALRLDPGQELAALGLASLAPRTLATRLRELLHISPR